LKVLLGGERHGARTRRLQALEIYRVGGGQHRHGQLTIKLDDDGFGQLFARNVGRRRDLLRGKRRGMPDGDVPHLMTV
jgi:hypothetical protein